MGTHGTKTAPATETASLAPAINANLICERTSLPLPPSPGHEARFEMEVYARFMRHLREVPNSRLEIKILSAIQFTADMIDVGDALIAKTLADMGLRAPRRAFPASFLDFVDRATQRSAWDMGGTPPHSILAMKEHWDHIGEDRFAATVRNQFSIYNDNFFANA